MPRFIANISLLFTHMPIADRFQAAKQVGFDGVEILHPYTVPPDQLAKLSLEHDCPVHLINTAFDPVAKNWGCAADSKQSQKFRSDIAQAVQYAQTLNIKFIHILSGTHGSLPVLRENLVWACNKYPEQTFLIEPINTDDIANYVMCDFINALEIIDALALPNLGLQFDTYHASKMGIDVIQMYNRCLPHIRHIQVSGNPNRTEPDQGIFDHVDFFEHVDASGYQGFVGAEYKPTSGSFKWLEKAR